MWINLWAVKCVGGSLKMVKNTRFWSILKMGGFPFLKLKKLVLVYVKKNTLLLRSNRTTKFEVMKNPIFNFNFNKKSINFGNNLGYKVNNCWGTRLHYYFIVGGVKNE